MQQTLGSLFLLKVFTSQKTIFRIRFEDMNTEEEAPLWQRNLYLP
jgi:hypothetical protein